MSTLHPITYQELVDRWGRELAFDILLTVEKSAKTRSDVIYLDEEKRFARALQALSDVVAA